MLGNIITAYAHIILGSYLFIWSCLVITYRHLFFFIPRFRNCFIAYVHSGPVTSAGVQVNAFHGTLVDSDACLDTRKLVSSCSITFQEEFASSSIDPTVCAKSVTKIIFTRYFVNMLRV